MAYVDPNFLVLNDDSAVGSPSAGIALSTITASGTFTFTGTAGVQAAGTYRFPVFKSPVKIDGIRVYNTGAAATVTGFTMNFLNGTSTIGSCTAPGTATFVDATLAAPTVSSNGATTGPMYFGSNGEITMVNVVVGTASAETLGTYAIDLIWRNLFT